MTFICDQSEDHPWVHLAKLGYKLVKYESKKCLNILLFLATYLNIEYRKSCTFSETFVQFWLSKISKNIFFLQFFKNSVLLFVASKRKADYVFVLCICDGQ